MSMSYVISILVFLLGLFVILGFIWYVHPFKAMTWFFHGILGWHKPDDGDEYYDGCSFIPDVDSVTNPSCRIPKEIGSPIWMSRKRDIRK